MPENDRPAPTVRETTAGGGLYLSLGALVVAVLVGAYVLMGTPGLHTQIASAPAGQLLSNSPPPSSGEVAR